MSIVSAALDILLGSPDSSSIAGLRVDAMLDESLSLPSHVTQFPVEEGSPISDGIIKQSEQIQVTGVITNCNITLLGGLLSGGFTPVGESKFNAARDALIAAHAAQTPVSIVTSGITYLNYGMSSCNITRRGSGNDGELHIAATFIKIRKATLQTTKVSLPNANSSAKGKTGATKAAVGKASNTDAPTAAGSKQASSLAYSLLFGNK